MFFFWLFGASILASISLVPLIRLSQYRGEVVEATLDRKGLHCPENMKIGVPPPMLKALWDKFKPIVGPNAKLDCVLSWHLEDEARKAIVHRVRQTSNGTRFWLKRSCQKGQNGPLRQTKEIVDRMFDTYAETAKEAIRRGYLWIGFGGACFDKLTDREKTLSGSQGQYLLLMAARLPEGNGKK